jgi:hypothetical protein
MPAANLSCIQKGVTYSCIKIFNSLPSNILKIQNNKSNFNVEIQRYLIAHTFYSLEDLFSHSQGLSWKS